MTLQSVSQNNCLTKRVANLLHSEELTDCSFLVGTAPNQKVFKAHKLILAIASEAFYDLLYETLWQDQILNDIVIAQIEPDVFETILNYIYTIEFTITSFDFGCRLWRGFRKFAMRNAETKCITAMVKDLNVGNCMQAFEAATHYNLKSLKKKSFDYIRDNATQLLGSIENIENLKMSTLFFILNDDRIVVTEKALSVRDVQRYADKKRNDPSFTENENNVEVLKLCEEMMEESLCADLIKPLSAFYDLLPILLILHLIECAFW